TGRGNVIIFHHADESDYTSDPLVHVYAASASDYYLPEPGVFDALIKLDSGKFVRTTPDGMTYIYLANGRLQRILHRYRDNNLELYYTTRGELRRIEDHSLPNWNTDETHRRALELTYYRKRGDVIRDGDVETTSNAEIGRVHSVRDVVPG